MNKQRRTKLLIFLMAIIFMPFGISKRAEAQDKESYGHAILGGVKYYETAQNAGSGKHGTLKDDINYVEIDGYAYVDFHGEVQESYFSEGDSLDIDFEYKKGTRTFYHIRSKDSELGWINPDDVLRLYKGERECNPEDDSDALLSVEKTADEITKLLKDPDSTLVFDSSFIQYANQLKILELLTKKELNTDARIIEYGFGTFSDIDIEKGDFDIKKFYRHEQRSSLGYPYSGSLYNCINMLDLEEEMSGKKIRNLIILSDMNSETGFFGDDLVPLDSITIYDVNGIQAWETSMYEDLANEFPNTEAKINIIKKADHN